MPLYVVICTDFPIDPAHYELGDFPIQTFPLPGWSSHESFRPPRHFGFVACRHGCRSLWRQTGRYLFIFACTIRELSCCEWPIIRDASCGENPCRNRCIEPGNHHSPGYRPMVLGPSYGYCHGDLQYRNANRHYHLLKRPLPYGRSLGLESCCLGHSLLYCHYLCHICGFLSTTRS